MKQALCQFKLVILKLKRTSEYSNSKENLYVILALICDLLKFL